MGISIEGPGFVQVEAQGGLQGRQGHLVGTQGPGQRVFPQVPHHFPVPQDNAGLGPAQELVAGKQHQVGPGLEGLLDGGLLFQAVPAQVHQAAAAQVFHDFQAVTPPQVHHLPQGHFVGEARDAVVAGMDLEEDGGLGGDGLLKVLEVGLVGGAHFPEDGAAGRHDLGHAEGAADLHQLAPGNDHFLARGQGVEGQEAPRRRSY